MTMKLEFVNYKLDVSHHCMVFSTSGGLCPAAKTFYKRFVSLFHDQPYNLTLFLAQCQIELYVCNHVSSELKIVVPRGACSPLDSAICPAQQAGMLIICMPSCL